MVRRTPLRVFAVGVASAVTLTACATTAADEARDVEDAGATVAGPAADDATDGPTSAVGDLPNFGQPPPLSDLDGWLQNDGIESLGDTHGRVTVVWFWTFGCINCKNTVPNLRDLRAAHDVDAVQIIGVHAAEFDHEEDPEAILAAAEEQGITWPIALDTAHTTFREWQDPGGNFWPRTFVLDQAGDIRFDHIGEGAYDDLNATVAALVADPVA